MAMQAASNTGSVVTRRTALSRALMGGLVGGLIAAVANIVVFLVAASLLQVEMAVPMGPGGPLTPLTAVQVGIISLFPGLIAGFVFWLLNKANANAMRLFLGLSIVILLLSFLPTFAAPGIAGSVRPVLALMHPVAAAAIVGMIYRFASK